LNAEDLVRVLTEPKNALVKQYQQIFQYDGVALEFTETALLAIAEEAIGRGTGARGLRGVMEELLQKTMFDIPSRKNVRHCVVHKEAVLGETGIYLMDDEVSKNEPDLDDVSPREESLNGNG